MKKAKPMRAVLRELNAGLKALGYKLVEPIHIEKKGKK